MTKTSSLRLPPLREKAAKMMAEGFKQIEIAEKLQRNRMTIQQWMKDPNFQSRVDELRSDVMAQSKDILSDAANDAATVIVQIATKGGTPGVVASKLAAAKYILDSIKQQKMPSPDKMKNIKESLSDEEVQELVNRGKEN